MDRYLSTLNNKSTYAPSVGRDAVRGNSISPGCLQISKTLSLVATQVAAKQGDITGVNLVALFWKPLGQEVIATMISHLRKQKITPEGAEMLMQDMDEYCQVWSMFANTAMLVFPLAYVFLLMYYRFCQNVPHRKCLIACCVCVKCAKYS